MGRNTISALDLDTLKLYLEDEQQRISECDDEYLKGLLLIRCASYERLIKELLSRNSIKKDWCEEHNRGSLDAYAGLCPECEDKHYKRFLKGIEINVNSANIC